MTESRGAIALVFSAIFFCIILDLVIRPGMSWGRPVLEHRPYFALPPDLKKSDFLFAGSRIPLERHDVAERIEEQINYLLMDRRAAILEILERLSIYGPMIGATLVEEKIPRDLIYLSASLSELSPTSRTKSGGYGWWNLASARGNNQAWNVSNEWDDRRDPVVSTKLAAGMFNQIRNKNPKFDWLLSIASFVDGADKIESIMKKNPGFNYWDVVTPPFSESLLPRIVALKIISENRKYFGVEAPEAHPLTFDLLDKLRLNKELSLRAISQWVGATPRAIWELNPGVDPAFGAFATSDKRNGGVSFLRTPKGYGQKVKHLLDSEGYTKN